MGSFICPNCKKETIKHAKDLCITCYKKQSWKPKVAKCKRCERILPLHAKNLCGGCYNFVFHLQKAKEYNNTKKHNISPELYKKVTSSCTLCSFDKIVELHHLDENSLNNQEENLIGLCPNHHKMFHDYRFKQEIIDSLVSRGIKVPSNPKLLYKKE
jgi:hypothetical protein